MSTFEILSGVDWGLVEAERTFFADTFDFFGVGVGLGFEVGRGVGVDAEVGVGVVIFWIEFSSPGVGSDVFSQWLFSSTANDTPLVEDVY